MRLIGASVLVQRQRLRWSRERILVGALLHVDEDVGQRPVGVHFAIFHVDRLPLVLLDAHRVLVHVDHRQFGLIALEADLAGDLGHRGLVDRGGLLFSGSRGLFGGLGLFLAAACEKEGRDDSECPDYSMLGHILNLS